MLKMVRKIVDDRKMAMEKKETKDSGSPNDAIDVLLRDTGESDGTQQRLPLDFISGNIIEMMIPGEDSVPMIMTLAVKYLSDNPVALSCLMVRINYEMNTFMFFNNLFETLSYDLIEFYMNGRRKMMN